MEQKIICRFATEKDFNDFKEITGFDIDKDTKEYIVINDQKINKVKKTKAKNPKIEYWETQWKGMPEYISKEQEVYAAIVFIFSEVELFLAEEIFNQNITDKTQSIWFPKLIAGTYSKKRAIGGTNDNNYPIYVVSKGRADICYTSIFLTQMEMYHYVVVEPQEYDLYLKHNKNQYAGILKLDLSYKDQYDTCDDLGDSASKGPGAARNFCWDHSLSYGDAKHWVFDDNANEGFHYMYRNEKIKCRTGAMFTAMEDFVDRYDNIAIAGMNYSKFCKMSDKTPAFVLNTRIYSFLLIDNSIPYRWRGRYNEDTDLSLRVLKDGYCTLQFNAFLAGKATTQKMKGGNTEEFYEKEGTLNKSEMIQKLHPDMAKVVWKFSRWHHEINYKVFKQLPRLKKEYQNLNFPDNDYGIRVIDTQESQTNDTKSFIETKYCMKYKYG